MMRFLSRIRKQIAVALGLLPLACACTSTIGKPPAIKCDIYHSRSTWMTAASIAAASLATGLATTGFVKKSDDMNTAVTLGTIGFSGSAAGLGYLGSSSAASAEEVCPVKQ